MPRYSEIALQLADLTADTAPNGWPDGIPAPFFRIRDFWFDPSNLISFAKTSPSIS
jgi:hypothetical protein